MCRRTVERFVSMKFQNCFSIVRRTVSPDRMHMLWSDESNFSLGDAIQVCKSYTFACCSFTYTDLHMVIWLETERIDVKSTWCYGLQRPRIWRKFSQQNKRSCWNCIQCGNIGTSIDELCKPSNTHWSVRSPCIHSFFMHPMNGVKQWRRHATYTHTLVPPINTFAQKN